MTLTVTRKFSSHFDDSDINSRSNRDLEPGVTCITLPPCPKGYDFSQSEKTCKLKKPKPEVEPELTEITKLITTTATSSKDLNSDPIQSYKNITSVLSEECLNYEVLDGARRHYKQDTTNFLCDNVNYQYKSKNWKGRNFYRIMNPAGTKIKEGCVAGTKACGTVPVGTAYLTIPNQHVKMTVCFRYGYGCPTICEREVEIVAINCGSYFVYDLSNMPYCYAVYCTE